MRITKTEKIHEGLYRATSLPCPMCNETLTTEIEGAFLYAYNRGGSITEVFPNLSIDERERFISGYCSTCWTEMFGDDEDEDDE